MIRPAGAPMPYAYQVPVAPPPPPAPMPAPAYRPYGDVPPPIPSPPVYDPTPRDEGKAFREVTMGTALHSGIAAAIGGAIGFFVGGPVGAAWGAGIGTGVAQAFMQFLVRMADGSGAHGPLYAAAPTALVGLGAWAAGAAWGAGAAAWTMVLAPLAVAGAVYAWQQART